MKFVKNTAWAVAALALLATSCKKDDDNGGSSSANTWKLDGTTYTASTVSQNSVNGITTMTAITAASGSSTNSASFAFSTTPTANGSIKTGGMTSPLIIALTTAAGKTYTSAHASNVVDANVTLNSGKITVTVPEMWVRNSMGGTDSVKFSCNAITGQ